MRMDFHSSSFAIPLVRSQTSIAQHYDDQEVQADSLILLQKTQWANINKTKSSLKLHIPLFSLFYTIKILICELGELG